MAKRTKKQTEILADIKGTFKLEVDLLQKHADLLRLRANLYVAAMKVLSEEDLVKLTAVGGHHEPPKKEKRHYHLTEGVRAPLRSRQFREG